jgi:hypothetical protein
MDAASDNERIIRRQNVLREKFHAKLLKEDDRRKRRILWDKIFYVCEGGTGSLDESFLNKKFGDEDSDGEKELINLIRRVCALL